MNNYAEISRKRALRPGFCDFYAYFSIFRPYSPENVLKMKKKAANKGLHRTAHKLWNLRGFATIQPVAAATYCACALSGEP